MRRSLRDILSSPLWADSGDEEIARCHGYTVNEVRTTRDQMQRDFASARVATRLRELGHVVQWRGTMTELLIEVLDGAINRAKARDGKHSDARMQELREALIESGRLRVLEGGKRVR